MATPIFNDFAPFAYQPHQPSRPSPLSSSPIRASSPPRPLSPRNANANALPQRQVQSSPIRQPSPASKLFKFAARPTKANPVIQGREHTQQNRRNMFLKGVHQRIDDHRWERRGVEQKLLSAEWFNLNQTLQRAKGGDANGLVTEADIADAERLLEEASRLPRIEENPDEMMVDTLLQEEDAEIEAFLSSSAQEPSSSADSWRRPNSANWSDDEDYDALFTDFLSEQEGQGILSSGDVEMG